MGSTRVDGESRTGSERIQGTFMIASALGTASGLVFVDTVGTEYVIWVDTSGSLRIGTRADHATPNSSGTVVGGQI